MPISTTCSRSRTPGDAVSRLPALLAEARAWHESEFGAERYFALIYGSFAYGVEGEGSDLDMVTVCEQYDPGRVDRVVEFTLGLHARHGLAVDAEVPHRRKLLANAAQLDAALRGRGFDRIDDRIAVPPVVKASWFLDSDRVTLRLLLNALTGRSVVVGGHERWYRDAVAAAREYLIALIFSVEGRHRLTVERFVSALMGAGGAHGEMYLGYKDRPAVRRYLTEAFSGVFECLAAEGKVAALADGGYVVRDYEWFSALLFGEHDRWRPRTARAT